MAGSHDQPWSSNELTLLLAEIIAADSQRHSPLLDYINTHRINPNWDEITPPPGRNLRSCRDAYHQLRSSRLGPLSNIPQQPSSQSLGTQPGQKRLREDVGPHGPVGLGPQGQYEPSLRAIAPKPPQSMSTGQPQASSSTATDQPPGKKRRGRPPKNQSASQSSSTPQSIGQGAPGGRGQGGLPRATPESVLSGPESTTTVATTRTPESPLYSESRSTSFIAPQPMSAPPSVQQPRPPSRPYETPPPPAAVAATSIRSVPISSIVAPTSAQQQQQQQQQQSGGSHSSSSSSGKRRRRSGGNGRSERGREDYPQTSAGSPQPRSRGGNGSPHPRLAGTLPERQGSTSSGLTRRGDIKEEGESRSRMIPPSTSSTRKDSSQPPQPQQQQQPPRSGQ